MGEIVPSRGHWRGTALGQDQHGVSRNRKQKSRQGGKWYVIKIATRAVVGPIGPWRPQEVIRVLSFRAGHRLLTIQR